MALIKTKRGSKVMHCGELMKVVSTPSFATVTLQSAAGEFFHVPIAELEAQASAGPALSRPADPKRAEKVPAYLEALKSLLGKERNTKAEVASSAKNLGISVAGAYRAINRFRLSGSVDDLPPPTRPGGRGKSRLPAQAEAIIQKTIDELMLNRRNLTPTAYFKKCKQELESAGFNVSKGTLNQRLANIPPYKWKKAREGYSAARRTLAPIQGEYPNVKAPLDVVQIDHWKSDIELVSDDREHLIGRAWVTLAIDIYSRMVYGLHVGFDAPSFTTVGLAMMSGVLRKDRIAKRYDLEWDNPIYGMVRRLEADNAGEFRGQSLQMTARHFNFELKWRPLGAPQYGGHIERLNGTLAKRFKELPGATGSNPDERKKFRPEKTAAFTVEDLTRHVWLMVDQYHNEVHNGIGMTPLSRYKSFFFGPEGNKARLPDVYEDTLDFRTQWYPLDGRTLQRYGIQLDYLYYYSNELEYLIKNRKKYGKIPIRRNPFDVREIFLLHPQRNEWILVPTRHLGFPVASLYELQAAKRTAVSEKKKPTPEVLRKIIEAQNRHIEEAQAKTKSAKRNAARRSQHDRIRADPPKFGKAARLPTQPQIELIQTLEPPSAKPGKSSTTSDNQGNEDLAAILAAISDEDIEDSFS